MTTLELLMLLRSLGVTLAGDDDRLKVSGPADALTDDLKSEIARRKPELLRLLASPATAATGPQPLAVGARRPLSPNQERLWSLVSRGARDARYNLPFALRLRGPLDVDALRRAIAHIVERHEVLRSAVLHDESGPYLRIVDPEDIVAIESAPASADEAWLEERLIREAEIPFELEAGRVARALVLVLGPEDHVIAIVMHHFAADGTSFEILFDELSAFYSSERTGGMPEVAALPLQYHDFAAWQHQQLTPDRRRDAEEFWSRSYDDAPAALGLPRPDAIGRSRRESVVVPDSTLELVKALAAAEATSPFVVSLAAYGVFMAHLTKRPDVILCSPSAGREIEEVRGLIGYFNNVLPLRLRIDFHETARLLVRATRQLVLRAQSHQALPFQEIASLSTTRRLALTRGMFAFHGQPLVLPRFDGVHVEQLPLSAGTADFDVALSILRSGEQTKASLEYRPGALGSMEPAAFLSAYLRVLDRTVREPDLSCGDLLESISLEPVPGAARTSPPTRVPGTVPPGEDQGLPDDPLELQLAVIWERVLEVRGISANDDFFDLGGHSLLAVKLLDIIEREIGRRLTLTSLLDFPTVRAQAEVLRREGWSAPPESLVPMYSRAVGHPVVLLHSFEGHTFLFNELARRVGESVPTYGLQAQGLGDGTTPHSTVEEMATHYLDELQHAFGDSPVTIIGMCFGNSLGLEMATRRADEGKPVRLILIDGAWEHLQEPEDLGPPPTVPARLVRRATRGLERLRRVWDDVRRGVSGSPYARREAAIRRRTVQAWDRYTPQPYPGRITLIRAHDTAKNPEKDWHVRAMSRIAQGGLDSVTVPGHHFTILREPHVAAVAEAVLEAVAGPLEPA